MSYWSTSRGGAGLGPTRLISPLSTLMSCGSSSRLELRRNRPSGVTRGSSRILNAAPFVSLEADDLAESLLGVGLHRAELVDREGAAMAPDSDLAEEHRRSIAHANRDGDREEERTQHDQAEQRRRGCR